MKVSRTTNTQRDELFFVIRKTVLDISKTTNKQMSDCGFFGLHKVYVSKTTTKQDIMFVFCYDNNKPKKVCIPLRIKQKL